MSFLLASPVSLLIAPATSSKLCLTVPRQSYQNVQMKGAAARGFGAATKGKQKKKAVPLVKIDPGITSALAELAAGEQSLLTYLNPRLFDDPSTMRTSAPSSRQAKLWCSKTRSGLNLQRWSTRSCRASMLRGSSTRHTFRTGNGREPSQIDRGRGQSGVGSGVYFQGG